MPQLWQCDVCGARYRVGWLSHCPRCEALPRAPKKLDSKRRRGRMPRIVAGVGPSNAAADAEQAAAEPVEDVTEAEFDAMWAEGAPVEVVTEPVAAPMEPEPEPEATPEASEPDPAPVAAVEAPAESPVDGAA